MDAARQALAAAAFLCLWSVGCGPARQPHIRVDQFEEFDKLIVDETRGEYRLKVWGGGPSVERLTPDKIRRHAGLLEVYERGGGKKLLAREGFGFRVNVCYTPSVLDYSDLEDGILRVVDYTYDPRNSEQPKLTPLICRTYTFRPDGKCEVSDEVLLEAESEEIVHVTELVNEGVRCLLQAQSYPGEEEDRLFEVAAHLRNVGVANYSRGTCALEYLLSLTEGGALAELCIAFCSELDELRSISEGESSGD